MGKYPYSAHSALMGRIKREWQEDIAWVLKLLDERILGDGDFVKHVLSVVEERMERRSLLRSKGYNLEKVVQRVCSVMELEPSEILKPGKTRSRVAA
ncbi:MAG: hypothetical protein JRK26_03825 [Deltaproteobacteria bacterium]|nr:hypothetical protein [Deltaproteobacteria bacterium]